jgi:hypothetical protein
MFCVEYKSKYKMTSLSKINPVSDFLERQTKALDQLREHLLDDLRLKDSFQQKMLESLVYAGLGFRAIREILPTVKSMSLRTYFAKSDWKDDFEKDLPFIDGYLALGNAFQYDPLYLRILDRAGCLALIPADQRTCQLSVRDQLTNWRLKGIQFETPRDLFRAAERGLLVQSTSDEKDPMDNSAQQSPRSDLVTSTPSLPSESDPETQSPRSGIIASTQEGTKEKQSPRSGMVTSTDTPATVRLSVGVPDSVEAKIFQQRMKELASLVAVFPKAISLFNDTQARCRPLDQWGEFIPMLKQHILPCQDMINKLKEV